MSRTIRRQLVLVSISALAILISIFMIDRVGSIYPRDVFWRYQGVLWSRKLVGGFKPTPFPEHSYLIAWVNAFQRDIVGPYFVASTHLILGISIKKIYYMPILIVPFVLSIAAVTKAFVGTRKSALVAIILGTGFRFQQLHIFDSVHRVAFGLIFFLLLIYSGQKIYTQKDNSRFVLIYIIISLVFIRSYSTLALAAFSFVALLFMIQFFFGDRPFRVFPIIFISAASFYYIFVDGWLITVLSSLAPALFLLIQTGSITSAKIIPAFSSQSGQSISLWYNLVGNLARILALTLVMSVVIIRINEYYGQIKEEYPNSIPSISALDAFLVAAGMQGITYLILSRLYAPSGGISPALLGLLIAPITGAYLLSMIHSRIGKRETIHYSNIIVVILILLVITPGIITAGWEAKGSINFPAQYDEQDQTMLKWADGNLRGDQRMISDFYTTSALYYQGNSPYQPSFVPSIANENSSTTGLEGIKTLYYKSPEKADAVADVYIVSSVMLQHEMHFLGGVRARPNPELDRQLSAGSSKIYSSGNNSSIFFL